MPLNSGLGEDGHPLPVGQFVNRRNGLGVSPLDVASADDPVDAGVGVILSLARPHEELGWAGSRSAEEIVATSPDVRGHGCCSGVRTAADSAHFQVIRKAHYASLGPEIPEEAAAADRASIALFMWDKCERAIQSLAIASVDAHRVERRRPVERRVIELETSLRIWERVPECHYPYGQGLGDLYPILLKDLDPKSSIRDLNDPRAREFAMLHTLSLGCRRTMELHHKFSETDKGDRSGPEFRQFVDSHAAMDRAWRELMGWVSGHVMNLRNLLDQAKRDLAAVDASPVNPDVVLLTSDAFRKIRQSQNEYETSYFRNLKGFDAVRQRLMTCYDRQMQHIQKKYPVMYKVGPLGIHMPRELGALCPFDQLEAMIRILVREQRYYDRNARNASREVALGAKPHENQLHTAVTWPMVDSADGINPRKIAGETELRPARPS